MHTSAKLDFDVLHGHNRIITSKLFPIEALQQHDFGRLQAHSRQHILLAFELHAQLAR